MTATGTESIRNLLSTAGPCITIISSVAALPGALETVRQALREKGEHAETLPAAAEDAGNDFAKENNSGSCLALLCAPDFMRVLPVNAEVKAVAKVGDRFNVRTLLAIDGAEAPFHILALSQKRTRLLRCSRSHSEEIPFPAGFPESLAESKNTDQPDHTLDNRSSGGPDVGSMKGVMFGTTTDREKKDEYLWHFFSAVDRAVRTVLKDSTSPLVVVAVENELAIYRRVNTYPYIVEPGVHGSPDGLEGPDMLRRALELIHGYAPPALTEVLAEFDKKVGTGHASTQIKEIVVAAFEGRVSHFFFQENAKYEGTFDAIRQRVKHAEAEDLVENAAYQTIMHGGEASIISGSAMPNGVPVCALFRYPATQAA